MKKLLHLKRLGMEEEKKKKQNITRCRLWVDCDLISDYLDILPNSYDIH